jgi:hypothetical protein
MGKIKKICPRCKSEFFCHQDETCWCLGIYVPEKISKHVQKNYADCLCKTCLLEMGGIEQQENEE